MKNVFSDGVYHLTEDVFYKLNFKGKDILIGIPRMFSWNGVTGFKTTKKLLIPSLIHDWLIFDERINGSRRFTREEMDEIFIIACKLYGVPSWQIWICRRGLNINRKILMRWFK